jgi:hypothetical protein
MEAHMKTDSETKRNTPPMNHSGHSTDAPVALETTSPKFEYDSYDLQLIATWDWEGNPNTEDPEAG